MPNNIEYFIIHCAATGPSHDVDLAEVRGWHLQRGFIREGYHHFIKRDGTIENGRPHTMHGAHAKRYNTRSLGICMAGGVMEKDGKTPEPNFTEAQHRTLIAKLNDLAWQYGPKLIIGHNDTWPTACPTFDVKEWALRLAKEGDLKLPDNAANLYEVRGFHRSFKELDVTVFQGGPGKNKPKRVTPIAATVTTVEPGDSWYAIAGRYNIKVADLLIANNASLTVVIHPGDVLKLR